MRPAHDGAAGPSATPIFDALYSEYRRSFRTLPGDRSGEEELRFRAFGTVTSTGLYGQGYGYTQGARTGQAYGQGGRPAAHPTAWSATQHTYTVAPQAALPPGPRRSP
ncbi:hypothetical protein [Streptomyces sp.]|uniref:hypothetical protein n=1 Tax=Streptomyces sp. TaxID=1931 RepID=UPI002812553E|nr:hypothetical protein [Streptomyces sp.]